MAEIISIFSPKGGVGKTFVAANLAAVLAQKLKDKKILLLDMDLEFPGDAATILDLDPQNDLTELVSDWKKGSYSPEQLSSYILPYKNINFDFSAFTLKRASRLYNQVDDKFLSCIVNDLSKQYDYIIADNGRSYSKPLLAFLGLSNLILIVVNPDILSVYKAKEALTILQSFYIPINMMKVVLNRSDSLGGVGWQEVMVALASELIIRIPSEGRIVGSALNRRMPLILDNKYCRVTSAFNKLAETLIAHPEFFIPTQSLAAFKAAFANIQEKQFFLPT
jgi:pilus assembly protein CpaE